MQYAVLFLFLLCVVVVLARDPSVHFARAWHCIDHLLCVSRSGPTDARPCGVWRRSPRLTVHTASYIAPPKGATDRRGRRAATWFVYQSEDGQDAVASDQGVGKHILHLRTGGG